MKVIRTFTFSDMAQLVMEWRIKLFACARSRKLNETVTNYSGTTANQLFTEEEHADKGSRRMAFINL